MKNEEWRIRSVRVQWNLLRRPPLGECKTGHFTEVAVLWRSFIKEEPPPFRTNFWTKIDIDIWFFASCSLCLIWIMKFFSFFVKIDFSHLFLRFFADVSKIFACSFLGNGSTDFAEIFTQVSYHYCAGPEPLTSMKLTVFENLLGKPKIVIFRASTDLTKDPATEKFFMLE